MTPLKKLPDVPKDCILRKNTWKAHHDSIKSMEIISDPNCLLTSSYDCCVHLWYLGKHFNHSNKITDGRKMDSLKQDTKEWESTFHFPVNIEKLKSIENETITSTMKKLKNQEKILEVWKQEVGENSETKIPLFSEEENDRDNLFINQEDSNLL